MRVAALAQASGSAPVAPAAQAASGSTRLCGTKRGTALHLLPTARTRAPLRFALARIAERAIATRAWERLGFARLGDYARERTGLSARQLQDLAHTSARLEALPGIEAALAAGRLGWSQARLVARVATPEDEAHWIAFARSLRVRELEHAVRAVDRGSLEGDGLETDEDGGDAAFKVGVVLRCTPRVRAKFHAARALARRVAGEALPIWACMEAVTAEALSALPVGAALEGDESDCASAGEGGPSWAERGTEWAAGAMRGPFEQPEKTCRDESALAAANVCVAQGHAAVEALLVGLEGADAFELDSRLRRAVAQEQRLDAELARFFFNAPPDVARLFRAVVCSVRRHVERATGRLASEGDAVEWMFEHAFEAWGANDRRVRREHRVFERNGWRCTVPGCSSYRNLQDHHIVFRAAGGSDDLANHTRADAHQPAKVRLFVNHRPLDLGLALFFVVTILYGLLFSLPEGLGVPVAPDSPWPPLRSLHGWALEQEPAHLDPPPVLIASCLFDGLFQVPALCFILFGLLRERAWVRTLSLVYAGAAVTNMFFYFATTFLGPAPPMNLAIYLPLNLPWLIAPALLGWRMRSAAPFASPLPAK